MERGSPVTSAASRDVKTAVMGASEMPPGLPLGLGAAVQAAASSIVSPRGAAKRKAGAVFNPVLMSGLNPVASLPRSLSPPGVQALMLQVNTFLDLKIIFHFLGDSF